MSLRWRRVAHLDAEQWRDAQRQAAEWIRDFMAPGFGPFGGTKLVAGEAVEVCRAAEALVEADPEAPTVAPYVALARRTRSHCGDGAATAVLLTARLVLAGLDHPAWSLAGYGKARRQALSVLDATVKSDAAGDSLGTVAPDVAWASWLLATLQSERVHDLDAIQVQEESVREPQWRKAIAWGGDTPREGRLRVLVLASGLRKIDATLKLSVPGVPATRVKLIREKLRRGRVEAIVCQGAIGFDRDELSIPAWENAPQYAVDALGVEIQPHLDLWEEQKLGTLSFSQHKTGWRIGAEPGTLVVPLRNRHAAERLLRAYGAWLDDSRKVPGDGAWQRQIASALRRGADAMPAHDGLAWSAAADAFFELANDLVRNSGNDPFDPPPAAQVWDLAPIARHAVAAAFDTAAQILRIDGYHAKALSTQEGLRGGTGPIGSRSGLPGDIPPLM